MREHDLDLLRIRLQEIKEMGWVRNRPCQPDCVNISKTKS